MTEQTSAKAAAHVARNAELKAEGEARRDAARTVAAGKHLAYLAGVREAAATAKAERIQAHNDRNASAKKPAKAA